MPRERHKAYPYDTWRRGSKGDAIECCSFCQMSDPAGYFCVERDIGHPPDKPHQAQLCEVCYKTWGGCAAEFPDQYEPSRLYEMVAQCTNMVMRKIETTHADDPKFDATDYAHPAWWRGHDYTMDRVAEQLNKILGSPIESASAQDYGKLREILKERLGKK